MKKVPTAFAHVFGDPSASAVSSSVPFNTSNWPEWVAGYGFNHSQKDEQGVVKERQGHAYQ